MHLSVSLAVLLGLIVCILAAKEDIARARIESCPGCQLNRLHEVKKFIFEDVPKYENVEFKKIQGAPPELVLLDEDDNELDRIPLGTLNRNECNELLQGKGFLRKPEFSSSTEL